MKKPSFWLVYCLLTVAQLLLTNYFRITPYVMLSLLPLMVMCIPIRVGTPLTLLIAFATGLVVDAVSEGVLGLNTLSLLPVAYCRKGIIRLVMGSEIFARGEDFTVPRNGLEKVMMLLLLAYLLFLVFYVWADSAGTRPFLFNAARLVASLASGLLLSLICLDMLTVDSRR